MRCSLDVKNLPLEVVLDKMLSPRVLVYEVRDKTIAISGRAFKDALPKVELRPITAPQNRVVSGRVIDETGAPLPGVSVVVKNQTAIGISTDQNGRYSLDVPNGVVLVFSMIGYESQEIGRASGRERVCQSV